MPSDSPLVIARVQGTPVSVPVTVPTRISTRALAVRDYLIVRLETPDGQEGVGYTYLGTSGGRLARMLFDELIGPRLEGRDVNHDDGWWDELYREYLLIGRRGLVVRVLSAVDIAIWDLRSRAADAPLVAFLGGPERTTVPAYASGGYYRPGDPLDNIHAEMERYAAMGFTDFKIKVGGAALDEDVARVRAARATIGDQARLALDANNAWRTLEEASRFIERVEEYRPWWVEEPLSPDDIPGHRELAESSPVAIATGEIHATRWEFRDLLRPPACQIVQPDAGVLGGVTEWLRVAEMARAEGIPIAPHWNANVHVHLVAAVDGLCVEYFPLEEGIFNFEALVVDRLEVRDGALVLPRSHGHGIQFDPEAVARYAV
jgi:L-alanine-DL-glutamate epimerase-like enolase superfamily enzyme